jgi:MFS family permease
MDLSNDKITRHMKSSNLPFLFASQSLSMSVSPMVVLVGGIVGADLAPSPSLATLPISLLIVGVALSTIPAALLMRRIGRRFGFILGAGVAGGACLLGAYSLVQGSFSLFCLSCLLVGTNGAFTQQYRFAAVESVKPEKAGRAVSLLLVGGIIGGYLGPELTKVARSWLAAAEYAGSYAVMAVVCLAAMLLLSFFRDPPYIQDAVAGDDRPLRQILSQPLTLAALFTGVLAYGVMSFIMTATPVEMHHLQGFSLDATAWVIQSHIIAMYLPSLFTGFLMERLGVLRVIFLGIACMFGCVFIAIAGQELVHYWVALVLLGLGWNFLFVSGTVLLTSSYYPAERFKVQAVNDFTVFGIQAFTSLSAGTVIFNANWNVLVLLNLPALFLVLGFVVLLRKQLSQANLLKAVPNYEAVE